MATPTQAVPSEIRHKLSAFDKALTDIENKLDPYLKKSPVEINAELCTLDKAKLDLVSAYTINSLFWMYLNVCGVNPKEHGIKQELDRIRSYMNRVKDIQEAEKAKETKLSVNVSAAKRVVKSALWEAAKKNIGKQAEGDDDIDKPQMSVNVQTHKGEKRKSEGNDNNGDQSKKKKKKKNKKR